MSIILRTLGINATEEELKDDYNYLIQLWKDIVGKISKSKVPNLIYEELDIIKQIIRDNFDGKKNSQIINFIITMHDVLLEIFYYLSFKYHFNFLFKSFL